MKEAKYNRRNVKRVRDRLYIDDELYEIHDDTETSHHHGHPKERNDTLPSNEQSTPNSQWDRRSMKRPHTSSTPTSCINDDMINSFVDEIGLILIESARDTLGTRPDKPKKRASKNQGDKPWFNLDCIFERQNYRKFNRKLKARPSPVLLTTVKESEKIYKKVMDKAIKQI
ncbi:unnamed protein product [Mytilus coruscus]|uniref:Uncharacterized protein n=1 Tax=Mytilus coruscus TaxID=42192 RepID=A0A6J8EMG2_MYTCO|nr:unnamed protein product [Mytilus coruscus]